MQKWEYLYWEALVGVNTQGPWYVQRSRILDIPTDSHVINGVLYEFAKGETPFAFLARLGREGWELVSASDPMADDGRIVFLFKRPAEQ